MTISAGKTDKGLVRYKNEDNFAIHSEQGIYIVADGIGGMPAGDIASGLVVEILPLLLTNRIPDVQVLTNSETISAIRQALIDLSNRLLSESQSHQEYAGMGSTVVMALVTRSHYFIAHLGDSRAYLLKNGILQQITNDHTLVRQLLAFNEISQDKHVITREKISSANILA